MSFTLNHIINVNNYIIAQSMNQSPICKLNYFLKELMEMNELYETNLLFENYQNYYPILPIYNSYLTCNHLENKNYTSFNSNDINNNNKPKERKIENVLNDKKNINKKPEIKNKSSPSSINEGIKFKTMIKNMEKFYMCNYKDCQNLYRSKENLVLHYKNKHLKEKPYHCSFCKATFSHRNGKTYHERKAHTLIFPHKCTFQNCDMKFASKSALNYHLKHQH